MNVLLRQRRKVFIVNCILTKPSKCIFNAEHTHYCCWKKQKKHTHTTTNVPNTKKCTHGNLCAFSWKQYRGIRHKILYVRFNVFVIRTQVKQKTHEVSLLWHSAIPLDAIDLYTIFLLLLELLELWTIVYVFLFYSANYCCHGWMLSMTLKPQYIYIDVCMCVLCVSTKLSQWDGVHRCKWREMYFTQCRKSMKSNCWRRNHTFINLSCEIRINYYVRQKFSNATRFFTFFSLLLSRLVGWLDGFGHSFSHSLSQPLMHAGVSLAVTMVVYHRMNFANQQHFQLIHNKYRAQASAHCIIGNQRIKLSVHHNTYILTDETFNQSHVYKHTFLSHNMCVPFRCFTFYKHACMLLQSDDLVRVE